MVLLLILLLELLLLFLLMLLLLLPLSFYLYLLRHQTWIHHLVSRRHIMIDSHLLQSCASSSENWNQHIFHFLPNFWSPPITSRLFLTVAHQFFNWCSRYLCQSDRGTARSTCLMIQSLSSQDMAKLMQSSLLNDSGFGQGVTAMVMHISIWDSVGVSNPWDFL